MNFQNILHSIKELHDIFYYFSLFCTYDDIMNISILNKEFNLDLRVFRNSERFKKLLKYKLVKRAPKDIILKNPIQVNQEIIDINLNDNIFSNHNAHNGDLILSENKFFILYDSKLFSMNYQGYHIPKYLQSRLGLTFFEKQKLKNISAFVNIQLEDFDFDYCKYYKLEFIIYIQVWNTKLKIFIWIYVWFIEKKIYYLDEIKNQAKSKISLIID